MSEGNPFVSPDNPLGEWNLPFESITGSQVDTDGLIVDSVNITAAVTDSPVGVLPVLLLDFASSHAGPLPRLMFVASPQVLRDLRSLVNQSVAAALNATAKRKGTPWA